MKTELRDKLRADVVAKLMEIFPNAVRVEEGLAFLADEIDEESGKPVPVVLGITVKNTEDTTRAKAYDIVLNGTELGGGSVRIYQDDVQEKMFEKLGFTKEQAYERFGFLMNAFKYGVPPHAGLAYGLDRLVMLLIGADNIREVIAFPKVKDASCLMSEAPNVVDQKQLDELGIAIKEPNA